MLWAEPPTDKSVGKANISSKLNGHCRQPATTAQCRVTRYCASPVLPISVARLWNFRSTRKVERVAVDIVGVLQRFEQSGTASERSGFGNG